eukprot:gnl/TRDRNA2_/TRDRNA2_161030_c1_seq1.p1 gnl/TRDRNA2_/TRDRNA2_161030_c1~~gnl/TRDRNA2_/TRDRNA2_161030_c1_seq1.p1  ORF type:complete len:114 (+),score=14.57 gnl/TRDRNA2_/TRDRNA2_161030_c1_seq1:166-507(+)
MGVHIFDGVIDRDDASLGSGRQHIAISFARGVGTGLLATGLLFLGGTLRASCLLTANGKTLVALASGRLEQQEMASAAESYRRLAWASIDVLLENLLQGTPTHSSMPVLCKEE